jgi:hypothetical protein
MLFIPVGCKTTDTDSGIKDSNFSKADLSKPSIVLWLASDGMVHYGSCPVNSSVVDRIKPSWWASKFIKTGIKRKINETQV